jgi:acyl phosphate:glycerol-3-phosphate acyltransferase
VTIALVLALGYLAGSVPFGVLVTRALAGKDVRASGSGNIGATNVARVAGKKLGALVLALDALKGALPVLLALRLAPDQPWLHAAVGLAAFLGHVFPVWLGFHGGKGVATALGVTAVLLPWAALGGAVVWAALVATTRISSVGSLAAGLVALGLGLWSSGPGAYPATLGALFLGMLWTHRGNLGRLVRRQEHRL